MQFSSRLTIAVHVLMAISVFEGKYKTTSVFLADSVQVNPVMIRNILSQLKAAGIVTVKPGEGGSFLQKKPADIRLYDVFCAVEKDEDLFHFHEHPNPNCPVGGRIHQVLDGKLAAVQEKMQSAMKDVTLADLLDDYHAIS